MSRDPLTILNNQELRLYRKNKNYKQHKNKDCGKVALRETPF